MPAMLLSPRALDRRHVLLDLGLEHAAAVFEAIGRLASVRGPRPEQVAQRLARRHRRGSFAIGGALVVPHAAVPALTRPMALYLRSRRPLRWGDADSVTDALALLVPLPGFVADSEWYWAVVQRLGRDGLVEQLRSLRDPQAVHRLLTGVEQ